MKISIFCYPQPRRSNIGDAIQTIALERLLTKRGHTVTYRDRDSSQGAEPDDIHIANGYLMNARDHGRDSLWYGLHWRQNAARFTAFAGIHIPDQTVLEEVIANSSNLPIGARDPWTAGLLHSRGVAVQVVGCPTLTLEKYSGPRHGTFAVDAPGHPEAIQLSHHVDNVHWLEQVSIGRALLDTYRSAQLVYTSRLHALLPCLAFGTPVVLEHPVEVRNEDRIRRFSLPDAHLHIPSNIVCTADISFTARRYERFLDWMLDEAAFATSIQP